MIILFLQLNDLFFVVLKDLLHILGITSTVFGISSQQKSLANELKGLTNIQLNNNGEDVI